MERKNPVNGRRKARRALRLSLTAAAVLLLASCVSMPRMASAPARCWEAAAPAAAAGGEAAPSGGHRQAPAPAERKNRPRLHVRYGVGTMQLNGLGQGMRELDRAGLNVGYMYMAWYYTGPGWFQGEYRKAWRKNPDGHASHSIRFRDLRFDVSFARRWAVGVQFSPLGSYSISGGKQVAVGDGLEPIQLSADFSGRGYFLTGSYIPFPGRSPDSSVLQLQAGIGVHHFSYTHHNQNGYEGLSLARYSPCFMARAEYSVLSRHWSINFDVNYKYARGHIPGAIFEKDDYSLTQGMRFHWRESFPAFSADMGGLGCGISLGFRL